MVDKIFNVKAKVLEHMEKAVAEGRMDVAEIGDLADIVKDLSEAEEKCLESEYYKSVTKAMGEHPSGYDPMGYEQSGYRGYDNPGNMGYRGRDSMGRYVSRRGYDDPRMDGMRPM